MTSAGNHPTALNSCARGRLAVDVDLTIVYPTMAEASRGTEPTVEEYRPRRDHDMFNSRREGKPNSGLSKRMATPEVFDSIAFRCLNPTLTSVWHGSVDGHRLLCFDRERNGSTGSAQQPMQIATSR